MNITQAKSLFLAQHLGQEFIDINEDFHDPLKLDAVNIHGAVFFDDTEDAHDISDVHLLLRTVSQLTDEECLHIASLFDLSEEQIADTDLREWIEALFTEIAGYYIDGYIGNQILSAIDYLRSIGILLPFTYISEIFYYSDEDGEGDIIWVEYDPKTTSPDSDTKTINQPIILQPEQIINLGWAKINEA